MAGKIITALTAASGGELVATSVIPGMESVSGTQARKFTITQIGTILNVSTLGTNTFTGQQTLASGTITTNQPTTLTQTWNAGGVTFNGLLVNMTSSASAAASTLQDWQLGSTSILRLQKDGSLLFNAVDSGVSANSSQIGIRIESNEYTGWNNTVEMRNRSNLSIGWTAGTPITGVNDTAMKRGAIAVISIEGASSAGGTFRHIAKTPAQITSNQDNYNPGGSSYFQRWSSDASRNVTGMTFTAAQVDGQTHEIWNVGSQNIVLVNSATSTAANQWLTSTGADITLAANKMAKAIYDGTTAKWRVCLGN